MVFIDDWSGRRCVHDDEKASPGGERNRNIEKIWANARWDSKLGITGLCLGFDL